MKLNALTATVLRVSQSRPAMEDKPSQATTDSQAEQPAQEAQASSVSEATQNGAVENSSKENITCNPS